jgi:hypothetical protein
VTPRPLSSPTDRRCSAEPPSRTHVKMISELPDGIAAGEVSSLRDDPPPAAGADTARDPRADADLARARALRYRRRSHGIRNEREAVLMATDKKHKKPTRSDGPNATAAASSNAGSQPSSRNPR